MSFPILSQGAVFRVSKKIYITVICREALIKPLANKREEQEEKLEDLFSVVIKAKSILLFWFFLFLKKNFSFILE